MICTTDFHDGLCRQFRPDLNNETLQDFTADSDSEATVFIDGAIDASNEERLPSMVVITLVGKASS